MKVKYILLIVLFGRNFLALSRIPIDLEILPNFAFYVKYVCRPVQLAVDNYPYKFSIIYMIYYVIVN